MSKDYIGRRQDFNLQHMVFRSVSFNCVSSNVWYKNSVVSQSNIVLTHTHTDIVAIGKPERQVCKASHWQQATIEITCHDHSIIACSRHAYMGVIRRAHPVRGESHIQRNANQEVVTTSLPFYNELHQSHIFL